MPRADSGVRESLLWCSVHVHLLQPDDKGPQNLLLCLISFILLLRGGVLPLGQAQNPSLLTAIAPELVWTNSSGLFPSPCLSLSFIHLARI